MMSEIDNNIVKTLFKEYAKMLSNKVKIGFVTEKTRSEYLYIADKLEQYLLNFDEETNEQNILNRIDIWNNSNKNDAIVKSIKRQLKLEFFNLSF